MTRKLVALVLLAAGGGVGWFYSTRTATVSPEVRTAAVTRGPVVSSVTATGTTEAVTSVTVGTQVSGTVMWLGADFNSVVKKGQVIARLDPSLLAAQVEQAKANLTKATADHQQRQMNLSDKETKLARAMKLDEQQLVSATDLGDAKLAVEVAKTDLLSAEAQVSQADASLNQARVNLAHATITAPIDGTVVARSVDVGQTVAASLSSPTLFLIAADLAEMRASLSVDESDISKIATGQRVNITVSAYPGERFRGEVSQIRLQPVVASNVTSYTTVVDIANTDLKLKPGMTVNANIEIARRDDVLRVPNAALRFAPTTEQFAALGQEPPAAQRADAAAASPASTTSGADTDTTTLNGTRVVLASAPRSTSNRAGAPSSADGVKTGQVWTIDKGVLRSLTVGVGLADATYTEVFSADAAGHSSLDAGSAVVTSVLTAESIQRTSVTTPVSSVFSGGGPGRGGPR